MAADRKAAFAEEKAEVEVLFANVQKLKGLSNKITGSLNRLESSGKIVQDAVGPIYGNTQKLQTTNANIDAILDAIERIREPLDQRNREERIIRTGAKKAGLQEFMASLDRTTRALADLKVSNLRSNQQGIAELSGLLKLGVRQLEDLFREILQEDVRTIEPLHYITKQIPFPQIPKEKVSRLQLIHSNVAAAVHQMSQGEVRDTPTGKAYAELRGDYLTASLKNLAAASVSTARKTAPNAIYRQGTNGIGTYASGIDGIYSAEYESVHGIFPTDEWSKVFTTTCQGSLNEFARTLRDLDTHVRNNLLTDCFLAYEIMDIVTNLAFRLESQTGELRRPVSEALLPVRETAKSSLSKLLEDTRGKVQSLISLPIDAGAVPVTAETMARLQTMTAYLQPVSSILTSLGDGGWNHPPARASSGASVPTLKSFDVGADGRQLFAHYAVDTLEALVAALELKARALLKSRGAQGVFMANNVAIVDRMIRNSDLQPLLAGAAPKVDAWRKKATAMYLEGWREPSSQLLDVQYTNRGGRPPSGGATGAGGGGGAGGGTQIDSAAVVKALASKDRDGVKEKFRSFNASFDELLQRHRGYKMEREVRATFAREVQVLIEPLYDRFWGRYHEIDKGKGKYVKYDKAQLASALASLG